MKRSFFQAVVTSILLYGCTTWTLKKRLVKKLDGNYSRMLRAILNKSWRQHSTRHQLYGYLPPITKTIQVRRTRTLLEKQGRAHKWCTLMDPYSWPCKSRTTSTNIHSATMLVYRMLSWRPAWGISYVNRYDKTTEHSNTKKLNCVLYINNFSTDLIGSPTRVSDAGNRTEILWKLPTEPQTFTKVTTQGIFISHRRPHSK